MPLTLTIYSFSYRKGIPEDTSGNGGGFVFDCRFLNNPGRIEAYQHQTGLDEEVIRYLEDESAPDEFLALVYKIADRAIRTYVEREYTHLMISFGCTGGQHRSVYCAEKLFAYLNRMYHLQVKLIHRELGINK